jgi:putative SOS response-associated peptidase YedK
VCNLYSLNKNKEAVAKMFGVGHNRTVDIPLFPGIFPNYVAPVVRQAADGDRELVNMNWGFVLPQSGKAPRRVTNVRDDKAMTGFWRESIEKRRCLVPASAFCEPDGNVKPATWNWFTLKGDDPRPLFAFAGIWRRHRGPVKKDGPVVEVDVYAFMTTTPNSLVATVNHERMPVLLTRPEEFDTWMRGPAQEAMALAQEYPPEQMQIVQTSYEKEDQLVQEALGQVGTGATTER